MTTGEATDVESQQQQEADVKKSTEDEEVVDYVARAQWLRAAVLGANDGLLSTASLLVGVGAFTADAKATAVTGIAGAVAGALSMAAGEFVSVCSQRDIELAHREEKKKKDSASADVAVPSPSRAAAASAAAFAAGAAVPLLAACFVREYKVRVGVVVGVVSFALLGSGGLSAFLGKAPPLKSAVRVLIGGWFAMTVTFGLTKLVASFGL